MRAAYEHNGRHVSREAFYAVACDPRRHVAVEACAGAGKTWMLVSRIVRALLDGVAPHEILAITFTKKAAGEMRQRLMEWLGEFAEADDEKLRGELRARGVEAARVDALVAPLRGLHLHLLQQGRGAQIRTFHSWFAALLRNAPLAVLESLGLPAAYELLESDDEAKAQLWRPFQARLLREPGLRADYEAAIAAHGRSQIEKALEAALDKRVEFALADRDDVLVSSVPHFHELDPALRHVDTPLAALLMPGALRDELQQAARLLAQASQPSFSAKGGELERALTDADASGVLKALLTADETARKFGDKLTGIEHIRAVQARLAQLLQAQMQHEAWLHQQRMTRLTRLLIEEYAELKRERGWVDMSDIERAALHLLKDAELGAWVQQRLDARTRHLLIDEFQDTNPLQWQALHAWLSAYAGSGGGADAPRLFIVGDPKQSIYRFRRAEPQIFKAAQRFVQDLGGDLLACDHTRRNASDVLGLVNAVLGQAQTAGEYEGFRVHTTESSEQGEVLALPLIGRPDRERKDAAVVWRDSLTQPRVTPEDSLRELECRQAARWVAAQIQAGLPPDEIMVLARKRDRLAAMQLELLALGVAATQPEEGDLGAVAEVQDVVALLDVLVSPGHELSLARALRSPLFGLDDAALIEIAARRRETRLPWFDLLLQEAGSSWRHPSLLDVGERLRRWRLWVQTLPPHDALDAIYADGDLLARFMAAAPAHMRERVRAHLQALLGAALQLDGGRYATPYALVRALRAGKLPAPAQAAVEGGAGLVRLLTVHGAKGLEADVVLMLDTDTPAQRAQTMGVLLDWPGADPAPRRFVFLASESRLPPSARDLFAQERQARAREELNALYVALTRARKGLVLSAVEPHQQSSEVPSWWRRLAPACATVADDVMAIAASSADQHKEDGFFALSVLPPVHFVVPAEVEFHASFQTSRMTGARPDEAGDAPEARIGSAMHRLLEWMPLDARDFTATQIEHVAAQFALTAEQARLAAAMAQGILHGEGAWAWRSAEVAWWTNEAPIMVDGQPRRVDRLLRHRDGTWWVLDYKSADYAQAQAPIQGQMLAQLKRYRDAVQAAYPGLPVRAAFLGAQGKLNTIANDS